MKKTYTFSNKGYQFGKAYSGIVEGTSSAGGVTVPSPLADWFIDEIARYSWARQHFEVRNMPGKTFTIPKLTSGDTIYLSDEGLDLTSEGGSNQASTSYTRPTWSSITLTAKKLAGLTGYSTELEEDSALNVAEIALRKLQQAFAEYEGRLFMQGSTDKFGWTAGDARKAFDGIIELIPGSNAGTGAQWTPDDSSVENWIDANQNKLTHNYLNQLINKVEEQNGICDTIYVTPTMIGRMRDPTEFEMFQSLKDIGSHAALLRGQVGKFYTADIMVINDLPAGDTNFVTSSAETPIIGLNRGSPFIADRRKIEIKQRHKFEQDVNEIRITERLSFQCYQPKWLAGLNDVKNST